MDSVVHPLDSFVSLTDRKYFLTCNDIRGLMVSFAGLYWIELSGEIEFAVEHPEAKRTIKTLHDAAKPE